MYYMLYILCIIYKLLTYTYYINDVIIKLSYGGKMNNKNNI